MKSISIGILFESSFYKYFFGKHKDLIKLDYAFCFSKNEEISGAKLITGIKSFKKFLSEAGKDCKLKIIILDVAPLGIHLIKDVLEKYKVDHEFIFYQHGFSADVRVNNFHKLRWWRRNLYIAYNYFILHKSMQSLNLLLIYFLQGYWAGFRNTRNNLKISKAYFTNIDQKDFHLKFERLIIEDYQIINLDKYTIKFCKNNESIIIGQNLIGCSLIKKEQYEGLLFSIKQYFADKGVKVRYLPHPREKENEYPRNFEIITDRSNLTCQYACGFYSTLLLNLDPEIEINIFYKGNLKFSNLIKLFEQTSKTLSNKNIKTIKI